MPEWAWVWRAWHQLDSGRAWLSGMAVAPRALSWGDVLDWAARHGLSADEADDLHYLIGEMEQEFRLIDAEKRAATT